MSQFKFKNPSAIYRMKQGEARVIHNGKITDDLALEFLSIRPERIELFSKFPENWKELIGLEQNNDLEVEELKAMKYNDLAKAYPDHFKIGMKKKELIEKILSA